jgi:hypothetical protein
LHFLEFAKPTADDPTDMSFAPMLRWAWILAFLGFMKIKAFSSSVSGVTIMSFESILISISDGQWEQPGLACSAR